MKFVKLNDLSNFNGEKTVQLARKKICVQLLAIKKKTGKLGIVSHNDNVFSFPGLPNGEAEYEGPDEAYTVPGG